MKVATRRLTVSRTARYFEMGDAGAKDVWVVLHGYGQLAGDFVQRFDGIADGRHVIAPEALSRFYVRRGGPVGASWMTREDRLAEISDYLAFLDLVIEDAAATPEVLTVLGFSQGAHTACRWAAQRGDVHRLVVWGSRLPEDLDPAAVARALRRGQLVVVAGEQDGYVRKEDLEQDLERMLRAGVRGELLRFDGGHNIDSGVLTRIAGHSGI